MFAYCKKFPLQRTQDFDQKILKHHFRYNTMTDLMIRSPQQISLCLDRIHQVFHTYCSDAFSLELSLYACFFYDEQKPDIDPLPICEFTCIDVYEHGKKLDSLLGVMFSSYLHDYDRESIGGVAKQVDNFPTTLGLWNALFQPSALNNYAPPLEQYPTVIFPQDKARIGTPSPTNDYMKLLGFDMKVDYLNNDLPFRLFFQNGDYRLDSQPLKAALVSCGHVFLEMLRPDLYPSDTALDPFNREHFNGEVKQQQKLQFMSWLEQHELVFEQQEVVAA